MKRLLPYPPAFLLLFLLPVLAAEAAVPSELHGDVQICKQCHEDHYASYVKGPHGRKSDRRTPAAHQACDSCHGTTGRHVESGGGKGVGGIIALDRRSPVAANLKNEKCLSCHERGTQMGWRSSTHAMNDLSCSSCHTVHGLVDRPFTRRTQAEACFACHKKERAQIYKASTHPIRDGKVVCSQCHNPHGGLGPSNLIRASVNETCYTCHAEKRGPFLWEHAPARENCSICHLPHGSNQAGLLRTRGPWLCQQCHMNQFHPSTAYSGRQLGNRDFHLVGRNCLNCHPQVHGSNHPSGPRLTR